MATPRTLKVDYYFDLSKNPEFASLFKDVELVWDALRNIRSFIQHKLGTLEDKVFREANVQVHGTAVLRGPIVLRQNVIIGPNVIIDGPAVIDRDTTVVANAYIGPLTYIGKNVEIRPGTFIRGESYIGSRCVIRGEIKHSVVMDDTGAPHHSYIGDSIVGRRCNIAAGAILSNSKNDKSGVRTNVEGTVYDTGLPKMGAILGDSVMLGCNVVTNPGTLIGADTLVYANASIRGFVPRKTIVKNTSHLEFVEKK